MPFNHPLWTRRGLHRLVMCVLLIALPCQAELTEDEIQYDPNVQDQLGKTGEYRLSVNAVPFRLYLETADLVSAIADRNQARQAGRQAKWMTPNEGEPDFSYEVWAPDTYDPSTPAGVMVFINSGNNGTLNKTYRELLAARNIIVIGANRSGNEVDTIMRLTFAFYAVELLNRRYELDPNRIYITGNSGGGRAASLAMFYRPELFSGGMPMVGCLAPIPNGNQAFQLGTPPMHSMPSRDALRLASTNGRYVMLTGETDFNRKQCEATAKYLQDSGFKYATVMVQPGLGHSNASAEYFGKALDFVDAPLVAQAVGAVKGADRDIQRGKLADAAQTLGKALPYLQLTSNEEVKALATQSAATLADLEQQYTAALAKLDQAIADKDDRAANEALRELSRTWRDRLDRETLNTYRDKIRDLRRAG